MLQVIFWSFTIAAFVNVCYFLFFGKFAFSKPSTSKSTDLPVSVVICAKDEAENLRQNLPYLLQQEHSNFEIVLINDCSSDETLKVMTEFQQKDQRIVLLDVQRNERFWGSKKYALTLGIKKAKNNFLLFTDADCRPVSPNWISTMCAQFSEEKSLVLGYGGYERIPKSLLNLMIRFETVWAAIQYFSFAKSGNAYMGVGRNLAYTIQEFYKNSGFVKHMQVRSGDDDLFINAAATPLNTACCFSPDSFTLSRPKTSWEEWRSQKKRHVSTSKFYKTKHKFWLGLFYVSEVLFWLLFIVAISTGYFRFWVFGILLMRLIISYIIFFKSAQLLCEKTLSWLFPLEEVGLICFQCIIFTSNLFSKQKSW